MPFLLLLCLSAHLDWHRAGITEYVQRYLERFWPASKSHSRGTPHWTLETCTPDPHDSCRGDRQVDVGMGLDLAHLSGSKMANRRERISNLGDVCIQMFYMTYLSLLSL